ncbi:MAG: PAAR-like domain-containing protein [Polyangiaceae bacterium]
MFPVATAGGGSCSAFPDTCKTPAPPAPPVPTPYPNMGNLTQANRGTASKKVKIMNQPAILVNTQISMTSGDEAGSAGGVVSSTIKGPAKAQKGSVKVKAEGQPVVFQTCPFGQNGVSANAPAGIQDSPSQSKVTVTM